MKRSYALTEAVSRLIAKSPFFACLLIDLLDVQEVDTGGMAEMVPSAATDGKKLYVNKKWFASLSLDERVGVLCHEVMHVVLKHPWRGKNYADRGVGPDLKPWNHTKWNYACDYIINDGVTKDGMGKIPIGGLFHPDITIDDLADEVYLKIPDPPEEDENWDTHLTPDPGEEPSDAEVQRAVKSAQSAAKSQGKESAWMKRLVDDICEPQVNWAEQMLLCVHRVAGKDEATWARPNRRRLAVAPHIYWPGTESYQAGVVAIYEDHSGSVLNEEMRHFRGESVCVFSELKPQQLFYGACSTEATDPVEMFDVEEIKSFEGGVGGGTDMPAIFTKLDEHGIVPDVLIILTDGWTEYGEPPGYPVIWIITDEHRTADHGETIHIKVTG